MLIHKAHLLAAACASTEDTRPQLNGLHLYQRDGATVAQSCDGHRLLRVTMPDAGLENYPQPSPEWTAPTMPRDGFILPTKAAKDALKAIPRKAPYAAPSLGEFALLESLNGTAVISTTDLDSKARVEAKPIDMPYPSTDQIVPDKDKAEFTIALNAKYLADLAAAIAKLHDTCGNSVTHEVVLRFYTPLNAVRADAVLDNGTVTALLMPIRMSPETAVEVAKAEGRVA